MNERIRQLALQADGVFIHKLITGAKQYTFLEKDLEKFAELIVAECLGIVDDAERGGSNDIWDNAVKFIRRDLREHFGVEE
jgi:hypothetical protein